MHYPQGVLQISSDRDDRGSFLGRKILESFLRGSLIKVGILGGIPNNLKICDSYTCFMLSENFYGSEIWHGIFWGLNNFWSQDFFGFHLKP